MRYLDTSALSLVLLASLPAQDWPQWRGPTGDGVVPDQSAPTRWDAETNVKWRTPLAQPGNGSPIVSKGRVFLTMPLDADGKRRSLLCFDKKTGKETWRRTIDFGRKMPTHNTNPHCSTTPAADGERVIVWHASAGLHCYDYDGKELWSRDLGEFRHMWGHGTSPMLYEDNVILQSGPGEQSFVAAFDRKTGKTVWKVEEPPHLTPEQIAKKRLAGSWCTPLIHRVGARDLVLCGQPTRVVAYDAATGQEIWWCGGVSCPRGDLTYSSPVVADDRCLIMGGYGGPSIGVRLDGEGDVTKSHRVWRLADQMSNCGSGIFANGSIFIPDMQGKLSCIDPKTGETRWRERIGRGNTWGSILLLRNRLYMTNQNGTTFVFKPDPEKLEIVEENKIPEKSNSTPAFSDGEIFLRTHEHLYCIARPTQAEQIKK